MTDLVEKFKRIEELVGSVVTKHGGWVDVNSIYVKTLHSNGYTVTLAKWDKLIEWPWHYHVGFEILVCPKGSFKVEMQCKCVDSKTQFILNEGGTLFIPPTRPHKAINLIENAELIGICVPPDSLYKEIFNKSSEKSVI